MSTRFVMAAALCAILAGCARGGGDAGIGHDVAAVRPAGSAVPAEAVAQPRRRATGFASLPDRGELVAYPANVVREQGAYIWHRAALSEAHALHAIASGHLRVTTPSGELLDFRYDRHVEHPSGDWTWIGHLPGAKGAQAILTFGAKAAFGSIGQPGKRPLRLTMRDGASWLVETNAAQLARQVNRYTRPDKPDYHIVARTQLPGYGATTTAAQPRALASVPITANATTSPTKVDVLIGYTAGFASASGGNSGAVTRLNFLVDYANTAYRNSKVNAEVRLVHAMPVTYTETNTNDTALEQLSGYDADTNTSITPNAAFNALRAARETYGADLVSLVRKFQDPEQDNCGIAWLLGGGKQGIQAGVGWDELGYSVVSDGSDNGYYCEDHTLAHELGHNMGSAHDRETSKGNDGVLDDPGDYGAYAYSFGYKTTATTGNYYTVMAYGDTGQTSYNVFSNPRITFCGGRACGTTTYEDNARSLGQTMPVIATFRATVVPIADAPARNDVDADTNSDLLFHNAGTRQFSYRIMDGAATVRSWLVGGVGAGYTVAATGDFNGDGKADVAWTSAKLDIYLWLGNGTGFGSVAAGTYPTGWKIVGAADVDGDGKADLLFHNASARQFSYRIMNGAATVRSGLVGGVGAGYTVAATGDFNGDGKADVAWTSAKLDIYLWLGNGTGFSSVAVGTYPAGWKVVGAGDVDGDGRTDLLFHNAGAHQFSYRIMNGATTVRSGLVGGVGDGYVVATTGDFNGDGKADVAWTSAKLDIYLWLGNGTGFGSVRVGTYPSGWELIR